MQYNQTKPNPIYLMYKYEELLGLNNLWRLICQKKKDVRGVMVIVFGNGRGDTSWNPGQN